MRIEHIEKATDKKRKITLDDGSSFVLYIGEIRRFHLKENTEVPDPVLNEILGTVLVRRARLRCMNLLKTSDRTVKQLHDRLKGDGYPDSIIENALAYVASYHYTDDERYAENYVRAYTGRKSRRIITLELEKRGVPADLVSEAFAAVLDEEGLAEADESGDLTAIRRLLEKKNFDSSLSSWDERRKMIAYLMRKGFSMSDIRAVLNEQESS